MHTFGVIGVIIFSLALGIMIFTLIKMSLYEKEGKLKLKLSMKEIWFKALLFFIIMYGISIFIQDLISPHDDTDVTLYFFKIIGYISLLSIAMVLFKFGSMGAKEKKAKTTTKAKKAGKKTKAKKRVAKKKAKKKK